MIRTITKAYTRFYRDNGQRTAYVEWIGNDGKPGRTEAPVIVWDTDRTLCDVYGPHMGALFARAICHGIPIEHEVW